MNAENTPKDAPADAVSVGSSALLCRVLGRLYARRDWLKDREQTAHSNGRLLDAGGWQCRAGGMSDAIDIVLVFEAELRHNEEALPR